MFPADSLMTAEREKRRRWTQRWKVRPLHALRSCGGYPARWCMVGRAGCAGAPPAGAPGHCHWEMTKTMGMRMKLWQLLPWSQGGRGIEVVRNEGARRRAGGGDGGEVWKNETEDEDGGGDGGDEGRRRWGERMMNGDGGEGRGRRLQGRGESWKSKGEAGKK